MNSIAEAKNIHPAEATNEEPNEEVNAGLPPLNLGDQPVSFFEFWPAWVFYAPIALYWLFLSLRYRNFGLPMVVNPSIAMGGMVGESKFDILQQSGDYAHRYILPYVLRRAPQINLLDKCDEALARHVENDLQIASQQGIYLPCVVKPDLGCRGAGVQVLHTPAELVKYLVDFPSDRGYLLQKLSPYSAEAGVFYERMPTEEQGEENEEKEKPGKVTSITLKYQATAVGDGSTNLKALILRDTRASILRKVYFEKNRQRLHWVPKKGQVVALAFAGSHCRGSIFRNGNEYISQALSDKIDRIMRDFPDFHYGRLDIKFKDLASFQQGDEFVIIEVNGVSSEKTHIWDSRTTLYEAFSTLFEQYTTLFKMGDLMSKRGFKVPSVKQLIRTWWRELKQSNHYPSTD